MWLYKCQVPICGQGVYNSRGLHFPPYLAKLWIIKYIKQIQRDKCAGSRKWSQWQKERCLNAYTVKLSNGLIAQQVKLRCKKYETSCEVFEEQEASTCCYVSDPGQIVCENNCQCFLMNHHFDQIGEYRCYSKGFVCQLIERLLVSVNDISTVFEHNG